MPAPTGAARAASSTAPDAAKLGQRAKHHADQGLNEGQVNRELMREGYTLEQIAAQKNKPEKPPAPKPAPKPDDAPKPAPKPSTSSSSSPTFKLPGGGSTAGVLLALLGYPLALAYLQGGGDGLKKWFRAKFLNQTATDPGVNAELFSYPTGGGASGGGAVAAAYVTPNAPKPTKVKSPVGSTAGVAAVLAFERAQLGKPYRYGANGPDQWDCSSLTQHAYAAAGVTIPRTTEFQILRGKPVHGLANAQPGDLIFPTPHHVQTYLGGGQILEAPHTGAVVRITPAPAHPLAIRRIL